MTKQPKDERIVWVFRFLQWFCPAQLHEEIEGDLTQKFKADEHKFGYGNAKRRLIWNVIRFFRPGILLRNKYSFNTYQNFMLRNHTKVIVRQISKNKTFSIINMMGLTLGITVCLLISQFVWFEWSFERFNENAQRTFRVNLYNTNNGIFDKISKGTVSGLAYDIQQSLVGIESVARLGGKMKGIVSCSEHLTEDQEDDIVFADPSIIDMLALDLINGDKREVLRSPFSLIISESVARKYFGNTHIVGKHLEIGFNSGSIEKKSYEIQGVFRDIPENSHQHFEFLLPPENEEAWNDNWAWSNVSTYVRLPHNV
jgi:putative ABC transport system permease protein